MAWAAVGGGLWITVVTVVCGSAYVLHADGPRFKAWHLQLKDLRYQLSGKTLCGLMTRQISERKTS